MGCGGSKEANSNSMAGRKFLVGGNWKMNGCKSDYKALIEAWNKATVTDKCEVVIGAPAPYLQYVRDTMKKEFAVSAQNTYKASKGAFTGEISPEMVLDCGATWTILGHSERRDIFKESDEEIAEKTKFCVDNGLMVMWCCGEHKEEREAGTTMDVVSVQLKALADKLAPEDWAKIAIAYEPVWAIGTGLTATPEQAQGTHKDIREWVSKNVSAEVAGAVRIQYGGSVKSSNCVELAKCPDIDGFLVGGASLKEDFTEVMNAADESVSE